MYVLPNIIRVIKSRRVRWAGHVASTGEMRNVYKILIGIPEGRRPLRRPRCGWEDSIIMDLSEIVWEGVDWIHLAEDRDQWFALMNMVMNIRGL
jgi:hypothetical protein